MKRLYLISAIIGFILPNILVAQESLATANWLLYAQPIATIEGMFATRISSIFMIDLLWVLLVFFVWSWRESRRLGIKGMGYLYGATMLLGLGGALPLFLYWREQALEA
ncbi:MAG: DUF2834 domain-containing protein [Bacteroidota bacterium]